MSCAMLIPSPRHTERDLADWEKHVRRDTTVAKITPWEKRESQAMDEIQRFDPDYISVSWGKDSTVLAHLVWRLVEDGWAAPPLVWFRVEPIYNPDCLLVRDAFLSRFPLEYLEIAIPCWHDPDGRVRARGTLEKGVEEARRRFGRTYAGGVRAEESGSRQTRMEVFGLSSPGACQPIGWWKTSEVFAYLHKYDLPIHPAYACTQGGIWERDRIRVGSLGTGRGRGVGRLEWELRYYGEEMYGWGFRV